MRFSVLAVVFLLSTLRSSAQLCDFNMYNRKGGLYYFSTFYQDGSYQTPMQDTCYRESNAKPYQLRVFKNGILQQEDLYDLVRTFPYSTYRRVSHDSVIAELKMYNPNQQLTTEHIYYLNKEKRRCWKEIIYHNGVKYSERSFRTVHSSELDPKQFEPRPAHLIDSEGYTDIHPQFGDEITYHPNGKIATIERHKFIVSDYPSYHPSKNGYAEGYDEKGNLILKGFFVDGRPHGKQLRYFSNGKISSEENYVNGGPIGLWTEYFETGNIQLKREFGSQFYPSTSHVVRYSDKGIKLFEKKILADGKGFETRYYESGNVMTHTIFEHGPSEQTSFWSYYESGQLNQKRYYRVQNDTLSVEYFEDGKLSRSNIQFKSGSQDVIEYYADGQLKQESHTKKNGDKYDQNFTWYYPNGTISRSMISKDEQRTEVHNWPNGTLKTEKHYTKQLLNGIWKEQDSTGHITKNCIYENGLRKGVCTAFEFPKIGPLTNKETKLLRGTVYTIYACSFHNSTTAITKTEKEINEEVKVVEMLYSYLKHIGAPPPLDSSVKPGPFKYQATISESDYRSHQRSIDSLFKTMHWQTKSPMEIQAGYANGTFISSTFFNYKYVDSLLSPILGKNSGTVSLVSSCANEGFEPKMWNQHLTFTITPVGDAWKVQMFTGMYNNTFVVYRSGEVELYNGIGELPTPAVYDLNTNYYPW